MFGLSKRTVVSVPCQDRPVAFTWLVCTLAFVVMPHVARLPLWITLATFCLGVYRLLHDHLRWRLPPRWVATALALVAVLGILGSFGTLAGRRAAIAFLIVLLGLKLLETRSHRDVMVLSCIGYFLVTTNFLYSQSPPMVGYLMLVVWLLTVSLMHFQHLGDVNRDCCVLDLRQGSLLLAHAVPLMVVLFVFFPRLDGPLWGLPEDSNAGVTGLSEDMAPGQLTQLSTSTAVAFRVEFDGPIPPPDLQYWRALVLWDYDGTTWRPGAPVPSRDMPWHRADSTYTYTVTLEPHQKRWLFSLDLPYAYVRDGRALPLEHAGYYRGLGTLSTDFQLRARRAVTSVTRYTLQSSTQYRTGALTDSLRRRALQLPATLDARVQQLAKQWRQEHTHDRDVVRQALQYFRDQPFVYTLTPPVLHDDPTAEFLFETRRGYCEHFASSFTVLMRAAGIPARIVVGYQGGEVNPLGNHLTVLQSNAHAWAEVWFPEQGWVRVDPTSMVAPERIERGIEALPGLLRTPLLIRNHTWLQRLWRTSRLSWDALHHTWNRWVVQYTATRQTELMVHMGLGELTWQGLTMMLVLLLSLLLAIFAIRLLRQQTPRDRVVLVYQRFCRKLARRGLPRQAHEGPLTFAQRVQHQRPELALQVQDIAQLYSALRYGRARRDTDIERLRHAVRAFRP